MAGTNFRFVIWRLRRIAQAFGWPAMLALSLLVFEAGFYWSAISPVLDQRGRLSGEVSALSQASQARRQIEPIADPRADLTRFYAALAQAGDVTDLLRRLYRVAQESGLAFNQAQYRAVPDPESRIIGYQILLPATGTYPDVRRFLVQAGAQISGLAVDSVSFQRKQISDARIEAQIKLTLFLGASS